ncbi:hypothetical protein N0V90_007913 [Kalmusia sp. IMI 367209]|nr:hypothetical protein N0V90_007913 [Kalmusia sp. IMI 367209]
MEGHGTLDSEASDQDDRDTSGISNANKRDDGVGPACQACRKKKAKCSRQTPCSQCVKNGLNCMYAKEKGKPGMKAGAIDRINSRMDALENMFLGQGILFQQIWDRIHTGGNQNISSGSGSSHLLEHTEQLKQKLDALGHQPSNAEDDVNEASVSQSHVNKRRRLGPNAYVPLPQPFQDGNVDGNSFPPDLINVMVDIYFSHIHPWIPILHVQQFRQRMEVQEERLKLNIILRAIASICVRFLDDPRLGGLELRSRLAQSNRQAVILHGMESFSVEGLQALIICAFDTIGSGRGPSAWSIVGSMARTVEQLQLSIEDEDDDTQKHTHVLVKRMAFLGPSKNWSEAEERRRVFWNVFLMDRFCSIATGWNVCLTSADVKRRLPCEGALWEEGKPLNIPTPFFGVSDPPRNATNALPTARPESADQASLGGFAYCIEATESLSLVTSFFLQQVVDVANSHDVQMWLMRFKQLDLRLIQ